MDLLTAHEIVAGWPAEKRKQHLPFAFVAEVPSGERVDTWPAAAVAACCLSTGEVEDEAGIVEALAHFMSLYHAGLIDRAAWKAEAAHVVAELMLWGEKMEALPEHALN